MVGMESRGELIRKGLSFLGRSQFRREVYRRINGRNSAKDIAAQLKTSANQVLNETKYLESVGLIRLKRKEGPYKIYEKDPKYATLDLESRRGIIGRVKPVEEKTIERLTPVIIRIEPDVDIKVPNLPPNVLNEGRKMARVYPYVYYFENSVRHLIMNILETKYGTNWWEEKVPADIKKEVSKRIAKEDIHRWHARRGAHNIFYSDMHDLYLIIVNNWADFKHLFPDQPWVKSRFDEVELSRNIMAHNNPLPDDEITRLKLDLKAWVKQISEST